MHYSDVFFQSHPYVRARGCVSVPVRVCVCVILNAHAHLSQSMHNVDIYMYTLHTREQSSTFQTDFQHFIYNIDIYTN